MWFKCSNYHFLHICRHIDSDQNSLNSWEPPPSLTALYKSSLPSLLLKVLKNLLSNKRKNFSPLRVLGLCVGTSEFTVSRTTLSLSLSRSTHPAWLETLQLPYIALLPSTLPRVLSELGRHERPGSASSLPIGLVWTTEWLVVVVVVVGVTALSLTALQRLSAV